MRILLTVLLVMGLYANSTAETSQKPLNAVTSVQKKQSPKLQTVAEPLVSPEAQPNLQSQKPGDKPGGKSNGKPSDKPNDKPNGKPNDKPKELKQSVTFKSSAQMNELVDRAWRVVTIEDETAS